MRTDRSGTEWPKNVFFSGFFFQYLPRSNWQKKISKFCTDFYRLLLLPPIWNLDRCILCYYCFQQVCRVCNNEGKPYWLSQDMTARAMLVGARLLNVKLLIKLILTCNQYPTHNNAWIKLLLIWFYSQYIDDMKQSSLEARNLTLFERGNQCGLHCNGPSLLVGLYCSHAQFGFQLRNPVHQH